MLMFDGFKKELNFRYDKHERIEKLSRDITIESKRTITDLQRLAGHDNPEQVVSRVSDKLKWIRLNLWEKVAAELYGEDLYRFLRAYSPGLQEYIEAVSFFHYLTNKGLVPLEHVQQLLTFPPEDQNTVSQGSNKSGQGQEYQMETNQAPNSHDNPNPSSDSPETVDSPPQRTHTLQVHIPPGEYLLGIADLTGELMRMTITWVGKGDFETPFKVVEFMRLIDHAFMSFKDISRDLSRKLRVLCQSIQKVEKACYNLQIRSSEIPLEMLVEMLAADGDGAGEFEAHDDL